jgi:tetratricopeptide (TPR) repeat protein
VLLLGIALAAVAGAASVDVEAAIARGDAAWARRAAGHEDGEPRAEPIDEAIAGYETALEAAPQSLEGRYRLLRALYFKADYVLEEEKRRLEALDRARQIAQEGLDQLAERLPGGKPLEKREPEDISETFEGDRLAAEMFFWSAVTWGLWGREKGKFAAARQGVAGKIRDYCLVVNRIDDTIENGGGHRVLGRLHFEAPHIPFVTGWVDRDTAVAELERAHELAPDDLLTRVYLAEALLEHRSERRREALELLESVAGAEPGDEYVVENLRSSAMARSRLAEERPNGS